ncbi:MAG: Holliday junction resolvase RuvX [Quisquiliibacterium sp.]
MDAADQILLAFDFGTRRTGVALGNTLTGSARALEVIVEDRTDRRFARIAALIQDWEPQRLVVGRPCHPDGSAHEMTARCERFARQLQGRFGLPVSLVDERYSSVAADPGPQGELDDSQAAATILRQYLHQIPGSG